jgi:hypothetical protein
MGTVDYEIGTPRFERRIGRRARPAHLEVTWVEPQWGHSTTNQAPREWQGVVEEVSVTGASVRGPVDLPVGPGTKAVIRYHGRDTGVIVRHCRQTDDPEVLRFGVEFAVLHPGLEHRVYALVAAGEDDPLRWVFRTGA